MADNINRFFAVIVGALGLIVLIMSAFKLGVVGLVFYGVFITSLLGMLFAWGVLALGYKIYKILSK